MSESITKAMFLDDVKAHRTDERLAEEIVQVLFMHGAVVATRLALMCTAGPGSRERELGGWCREAAIRQVVRVLLERP
jgi:hypothetical protein